MDNAARVLGGKGEFAIITASLTAANMIEWQKCIEQRRKEKYPQIKMAALRPCDDLQKKAFDEANTIMNADPGVKLIMAICSPAVPGAAEAVKQSGRTDVKVIGLGLPNDNKRYVHEGITDCVVLWNTMDLGYLTVQAARALADGTLKRGDTSLEAGRLKSIEIQGDNILLGQPFLFTKDEHRPVRLLIGPRNSPTKHPETLPMRLSLPSAVAAILLLGWCGRQWSRRRGLRTP